MVSKHWNQKQYRIIPDFFHDFASGPAVETQLSSFFRWLFLFIPLIILYYSLLFLLCSAFSQNFRLLLSVKKCTDLQWPAIVLVRRQCTAASESPTPTASNTSLVVIIIIPQMSKNIYLLLGRVLATNREETTHMSTNALCSWGATTPSAWTVLLLKFCTSAGGRSPCLRILQWETPVRWSGLTVLV